MVAGELSQGQGDGEGAAFARPAGDGDTATVQLDEPFRQRQPQAGTLSMGRARLVKLVEDPLLVLRRDADARVPHRDLDDAVCPDGGDLHAAAVRGELDGV